MGVVDVRSTSKPRMHVGVPSKSSGRVARAVSSRSSLAQDPSSLIEARVPISSAGPSPTNSKCFVGFHAFRWTQKREVWRLVRPQGGLGSSTKMSVVVWAFVSWMVTTGV